MADETVKDRPAQWPSPWPYDFPVEGKVPAAPDKVARVAGRRGGPRSTRHAPQPVRLGASLGWGAFVTAGGVGMLGLVRFLFPNVSFEPPQVFKTDSRREVRRRTRWTRPGRRPTRLDREHRGHASSRSRTVCTHLGCTPNWLAGREQVQVPLPRLGLLHERRQLRGPDAPPARALPRLRRRRWTASSWWTRP